MTLADQPRKYLGEGTNASYPQAETLVDLIAAASDQLTVAHRRIAAVVLEDPTIVAFGTISQIANMAGTSRPSVVRFANRLGFSGFSELQSYVQHRMARLLSRPSERIRGSNIESLSDIEAVQNSVSQVVTLSGTTRFDEIVEATLAANNVWIVSGETSMAGACVLESGLTMIRPRVRLLEDHHLGRDLTAVDRGDVLVAIDFYRYRRSTILAAQAIVEVGTKMIAITDGPLSPLASMTDLWCGIEIPAVGPFDSSVPAVLMSELVVAKAASRQKAEVSLLIDRTEQLWRDTEAFFDTETS